MDNPAQRGFETQRIMCFRHPSIDALGRYYLPFPPQSIPGKCFVSLPRRQAAELARQQAEVLGVGRLEKKQTITQATAEEMPTPAPAKGESMDAMMDAFSTDLIAGIAEEAEPHVSTNEVGEANVEDTPLPTSPPTPEHVFVPLPSGSAQEPSAPLVVETPAPIMSPEENKENVPMPVIEEEHGEQMSDIEIEFRELVNGLLAAGVEPNEMMDDPRWEEINERATAVGFETWPVFLQLATME